MRTGEIFSEDWRRQHTPTIKVYPSKDELLQVLAGEFLELTASVQRLGQRFSVLMGGGRTPIELNRRIIDLSERSERLHHPVDWRRIDIWFSDERCVPPDHADSNYKLIFDTLIRPLGIPQEQVNRVKGELSPRQAASDYHHQLSLWAGRQKHVLPVFDLALLGLGPDGHTASLFPGSPALKEFHDFAAPAGTGPEGWQRVSVTLPVLNNAQNVWLVASGVEKSSAVKQLLNGDYDPLRCPVQGVFPRSGKLIYWLDTTIAKAVGIAGKLPFK